MGFLDRLFGETHVPGADGVRILDVPSSTNLRELGNYDTPDGPTQPHRFLRCGSTRCLTRKDRAWLRDYGVTHVLDLRSSGEDPSQTCPFARERGVIWKNVELFGRDISTSRLAGAPISADFHVRAYLAMLANHEAVRQIMSFLAMVPQHECVLFHCAAGMDRTGVTSMLLLGTAGVSREDITRDYLYSFARVPEVDRFVNGGAEPRSMDGRLHVFLDTMGQIYDAVREAYGGIGDYLLACGLADDQLAALRSRLLDA